MKHGSLFSGIGGFDLAAEWMGWQNMFHCEWNEFGQKVLHHYWPNAETFTDITKSDFKKYYGTIDILTGGFPCQPYSAAGKRKGKEDERHLWPEMLRAIREISPRFVVGENVRGLTNWNGGLVFDEVCTELESLGYQVAPVIIPASGVGAPHKRERIWFVAYNDGKRQQGYEQQIGNRRDSENQEQWVCLCKEQGRNEIRCINEGNCKNRNTTNASSIGQKFRKERKCSTIKSQSNNKQFKRCSQFYTTNFQEFPTQPPICGGDYGLPTELDGITFSKWRSESIKAYGNAIVPQVAYQIFKAIEQTINK